MNDGSVLKFSDIEAEDQRNKEKQRFQARIEKSQKLGGSFRFRNATSLAYKNTLGNPNYVVYLGLEHIPRTPRNIKTFGNERYTLRTGSTRSLDRDKPPVLRAVSCSCPDYTKRTDLNAGHRRWDGGPCVSNAYGCKHMMAANMFLGLPPTMPTDVDA